MPNTNNQRRKGLFGLNFRHFGPWLAVVLCLSCGEAEHYGRRVWRTVTHFLEAEARKRYHPLKADSGPGRWLSEWGAYCATMRMLSSDPSTHIKSQAWWHLPVTPPPHTHTLMGGSTETGISWSLLAWWTKQVMSSERPWLRKRCGKQWRGRPVFISFLLL